MAGLVVLTLLVRLTWGWWTARQVRIELAELRAQGEPVELADILPEPVPDAENAWFVQLQAMGAVSPSVDSPRNSTLDYPNYPPFSADWMKLAAASEQANAPAFATLRQARALQRVGPLARPTSPFVLTPITYLSPARTLATTLADGAVYAHLQGDDREAFERVLDLLHLSRSLRHGPFRLDHLVAAGNEATACGILQVIGSGIGPRSAATTRPASLDQIRRTIDQLLDERPAHGSLRRSMATERLVYIDYSRFRSSRNWAIRPLADRDIIRSLPNFDLLCQAAQKANWPEAQAVLARCRWDKPQKQGYALLIPSPAAKPEVPRYSRWYGVAGDVSGAIERQFRILAERRLTAVALACHLYRIDHGRWPDQLTQLVPRHLPVLPADPYHADGRPIGCTTFKGGLPGGGDRPMLFYDAGPDDPVPSTPCYAGHAPAPPRHPSERVRQYRDLTRFIPPPSPEAVDDDPQKADAPGQDAEGDDAGQ